MDRMFHFTSILKPDYSKELEQLMFFNPGQQTALSAIVDSIEMYGEPIIYNDGERLRLKVKKFDEVQILFALDGNILAGVLLYSRVSIERLVVIHIAVDEDYSSQGKFAKKILVMRMSQQLRESARRIKGIETIRMMYGVNRTRDYLVKRDIFHRQKTKVVTLDGIRECQAY
jgi:hypothetical protein